ncbi:hypothetical protein AB6A23_13315 [Paenibacillus tarimensis]
MLVIDLYDGRLRDIRWEGNPWHHFKDIHMPIEAFMHLLFGQKDIEELMVAYREVGSWNSAPGLDNEMRILLKVLFPKKPSHIILCKQIVIILVDRSLNIDSMHVRAGGIGIITANGHKCRLNGPFPNFEVLTDMGDV